MIIYKAIGQKISYLGKTGICVAAGEKGGECKKCIFSSFGINACDKIACIPEMRGYDSESVYFTKK